MTRPARRLLGRLAVVVAAAAIASACSGSDGPSEGQASLRVLDGSVTHTTDDGVETVTGSATLDLGDTVTVDTGSATVEFADGSIYELRAGAPGSTLEIAIPPVLVSGDALVVEGFPATLVVDGITLTALGVLEVDGDTKTATAFSGRTTLAGLGSIEELPGLRRLVLSAAGVAEPAVYDGTDEWDRRYLGEAIAFGERLESLARGYTNDLRPGGRTVSFYEAVLPALAGEREFGAALLDGDRSPGDTLVGAAITVQGRDDTFLGRWRAVFGFRDEGAVWGLVALDQGVSSAPVLDTIELAIDESPLSDRPRPPTTSGPRQGPSASTTTTTTAPVGGGPTSTTTTTTTQPPEDEVLPPLLDPALDPVNDLFEGLGFGTP